MDRRKALKQVAWIMGGSISLPAMSGVLAGCTPSTAETGKLVFFTPTEFDLVSAMADRILPATATPGALDVRVPGFIDLMLQDVYTVKLQETVKAGVSSLNQLSQTLHGQGFHNLAPEKQDALLLGMEEEALVASPQEGKPFFSIIKELTLLGYFTSEEGAKATLDFVPIPGKYEGCIPYEGKAAYI
ncbi:MAG: gluconate 2-dehydrogenase subunit 3 family protein [Bacteroidota bacterium]